MGQGALLLPKCAAVLLHSNGTAPQFGNSLAHYFVLTLARRALRAWAPVPFVHTLGILFTSGVAFRAFAAAALLAYPPHLWHKADRRPGRCARPEHGA